MTLRLMALKDLRIDEHFASRLPPPPKAEREMLLEDIRENGILVPLLATKDGLLLDGHRRLDLAKELGLKEVPVQLVDRVADGAGWESIFSILVNLDRSHFNEAQRSVLATSLERIERPLAEARAEEGRVRGGRLHRKVKLLDADGGHQATRKPVDAVTARVAARANVSRDTYERVKRVMKADTKLGKKMIDGDISVAGAAKQIKVREIKQKAAAEKPPSDDWHVKDLSTLYGKVRTIYQDPPWGYADSGSRGSAEGHYPTLSIDALKDWAKKGGVAKLAHEDGCHVWTWTTWPMIRDKAPHEYLEALGAEWVGEYVWHKAGGVGTGRWLRPVTEILILSVIGKKLPLMDEKDLAAFVSTDRYREKGKEEHSKKPESFYDLIERLSPGPRIELFSRNKREGWYRYGYEAS